MDRSKVNKKLISVSLSGLMLLGIISGVVSAATVYAQGGKWEYGVGEKYVWSYYSHGSKYHASTAIGKYPSESGKTRPGVKAQASAEKSWSGNQTYYKVY